MNQLVLYLAADWPAAPHAHWVLLDARDRVVQSGHSDARHWPPADRLDVILGGAQCSALAARLPAAARSAEARLLRYALEEQLLRDPDEQHLTITARASDEHGQRLGVLAISRARLRQILAALDTLQRPPTRVFAALQTVVGTGSEWTLYALPDDGWIAHAPPTAPFAVSAAEAAPLLAHLLAQPGLDTPPTRLLCVPTQPHPAPETLAALAATAEALGLAHEVQAPLPWWHARHSAANLLHGEFARGGGRAGLLRALLPPFALAAGVGAIWLAVTFGHVLWQGYELRALEERQARLFQTALPNTPLVSPALQLQRALDAARARHGQLRADDFLALFDAFSEIGGGATRGLVQRVDYEGGQLMLRWRDGHDADVALLDARLAALGYQTAPRTDGEPGLILSRQVQP